ncbi:MAG: DNA repair exonuclease [Euryarchaeota archaeon]|nr:DNA repair exonuclease [Euryarchaeota archaeon]
MRAGRPIEQGTAFTVVHTADLHLGSGMRVARRLGREEELNTATYDALDRLIDLCDRIDADILTLGGDLFDEPNMANPGPRLRLKRALGALEDTNVAIVRGNHDHLGEDQAGVPWPDNVTEFAGPRKTLDLGWVRVHGVSYTRTHVTESLVPRYPDGDRDHFDIGLLHANVGGDTHHQPYSPCTVSDLTAKGYRMWLLGHIHKRQVLSEDPLILYPGNLQGRDVGETGDKSVEVIEVSGAGTLQHRAEPVAAVQWCHETIDVSGCDTVDDVENRVFEALRKTLADAGTLRGVVARIDLVGATAAHGALTRAPAAGATTIGDTIAELVNDDLGERNPFLLVDKVRVRTQMPIDLDDLRAAGGIHATLIGLVEAPDGRAALLDALAADGPTDRKELERLTADLWTPTLHNALARLRGGDA